MAGDNVLIKNEVNKLRPGVYRIHWFHGQTSVAAVGITYDGKRWLAATNWTSSAKGEDLPRVASISHWRLVDKVELIAET